MSVVIFILGACAIAMRGSAGIAQSKAATKSLTDRFIRPSPIPLRNVFGCGLVEQEATRQRLHEEPRSGWRSKTRRRKSLV
jgi:hypothetical protein